MNVVRQTISKWEQGLSVPDSEMLISISKVLDTPVSTLLGETTSDNKIDDLKIITKKLETINFQLSQKQKRKQKIIQGLLMCLCLIIIIIFIILLLLDSPYLKWDYSNPENAVLEVAFHTFEWLFIRIAPIFLIGSIICIILVIKRYK